MRSYVRSPEMVMGYQSLHSDRGSAFEDPGPMPATPPSVPGDPTHVYRFYDVADQLLYVGITRNLKERLAQHKASKPWWDEIADAKTEMYGSRADALRHEANAIFKEHPRYNIVHPSRSDLDVLADQVERERRGEPRDLRGTLLDHGELHSMLDRQARRHFDLSAEALLEAYHAGDNDRDDERLRFVANLMGASAWLTDLEARCA